MLISILTYILLAVELALCLVIAYLLLLTGASLLARRNSRARMEPSKKFAILIPAYNEELLLGKLLDSLNRVSYPKQLYDIYVVADNCTDDTASIARQHGANVYERHDPNQTGKGYALRYLLSEVFALNHDYDAFIIFDADSEISTNFLDVMNEKLCHGSKIIQGYYNVLNAGESSGASLRYIALVLVHYIRPLAKSALGISCGLKGNGMCFTASVLKQYDWDSFTLAEDVEMHLKLVSAGLKVDFAPEALVLALMPTSLKSAKSQNLRWESGRLMMARKYAPKLLLDGLRSRSLTKIDAALEQIVPPLSVPFILSIFCLLLSLLLGQPLLISLSGAAILGILVYVFGGLVIARVPIKICLSLFYAPVYLLWKIRLYLSAAVGSKSREWIRTTRSD